MNKEKLLKFFQPKWWVLVILVIVFVFGVFQLSIYLNVDIFFTIFATYFYCLISSIILLIKKKKVLANSIFLFVLIILFVAFFVARGILAPTNCGIECAIPIGNNPEVATALHPIFNIPYRMKLTNGIGNQVVLSFYNNHSVECFDAGASFRFNCASSSNSTFTNFRTIQTPVHIGYHQVLIAEFTPNNFSGTVPCMVEVVCSAEEITPENIYDLPVVESKALFIEFN